MGRPEMLIEAFERIDAANGEDPRTVDVGGEAVPKELLYGRRMTACLQRYEPKASVALQLAARAQHVLRWQVPRDDYPMDRRGYRQWREHLYEFHAQRAAEILDGLGIDGAVVSQMQDLLRKHDLDDPQMQILEDVICLVFIEHELEAFADKHDGTKVVKIIQRTWAKMSTRAHEVAQSIEMAPAVRGLVERALA